MLVGCSELLPQTPPSLVVDGVPIHGRAEQIPKPEIRAVIALDRCSMAAAGRKIYLIDVTSSVELHLYRTPRNPRWQEYQIYRRIAGKWRSQGRMIGGSILFP